MKKIFNLLLTLFLISLFSCDLSRGEIISNLFGAVLETDSSGHFTEDVTYTYYNYGRYLENWNDLGSELQLDYNEVFTYNSDGTYINDSYAYEAVGIDLDGDGVLNEGLILVNSVTGTYTYINYLLKTKILTDLRYIDSDNNNAGERFYFWDADATLTSRDFPWVNEVTYYITSNYRETLYKNVSEGVWQSTYKSYSDEEGYEPYISTSRYTVTEDSVSYTSGSSSYEREDVLKIIETSGDDEFVEGSIVEYKGIYTISRYRDYDSDSESWNAWDNEYNYDSLSSIGLINLGDYIIRDYALTNIGRGL